jgi:hypothetical protein
MKSSFATSNKKVKIVAWYLLSLLLLYFYWYMENSTELYDFLQKADRARVDWAFEFYAWVGLVQYTCLVAGVLIPIILTGFLIRESK